MRLLYLIIVLGFTTSVWGQSFPVDTLLMQGPTQNRLNVVVLGDGFTESEYFDFQEAAHSFKNTFLASMPYRNYQNYFNFFGIFTPSKESGVSNPGTAPDAYTEQPVSSVNNFYGSTFGGSIHRLVVIRNYSLMYRVLADNFPEYDLVVLIANSPFYGGSGGAISVFTLHDLADQIGLHEVGHTLGKLSDEYWAGVSYARENFNMTRETDRNKVRWKDWFDIQKVGIYRYGNLPENRDWYKPVNGTCLMEFLNRELCPVCKENTVEEILKIVNVVDEVKPASGSEIKIEDSIEIELKPVYPIPNTLSVKWFLNDELFSEGKDKLNISRDDIDEGRNTLKVEVYDATFLSKKPFNARKKQFSWTLIAEKKEVQLIVSPSNLEVCVGETVNFSVSGCIDSPVWSNEMTGPNISFEAKESMNLGVSCKLENGKEADAEANLKVHPKPEIEISASGAYYEGDNINLRASGGSEYYWTGPVGFTSNQASFTISDVQISHSGTYTVWVKNGQGCEGTADVEISVKELRRLEISPSSFSVCAGEKVHFAALGCAGMPNWSNGMSGSDIFFEAKESMTLGVSCKLENGKEAGAEANLKVHPKPEIEVSSSGVYYEGDNVNFWASGGSEYYWTGPGNFTSNISNPTIENAQLNHAGIYSLIVKSEVGCESKTEIEIIINKILSKEEYLPGNISVFPNPSSDRIINLHSNYQNILNYRLISIDGRVFRKGNFNNAKIFNLSDLPAGVYLFLVSGDHVETAIRLILY